MAIQPNPRGTLRLFTFQRIPVFVHWSWLMVGIIELQWRADSYDSPLWNAIEYVALFAIVLLHEFGHALACRSVGGTASRILLWPLGGVAYVRPPPRPGALLWSIAAGPLVNVVLAPLFLALALSITLLLPGASADVQHMLWALFAIDVGLLVFNVLPIYPLDGGQILQALLWFVVGRERSLTIAAGIGLVASIVGGLAALILLQSIWLGIIAAFAAWRSWTGLKVARARATLLAQPRHTDIRCPHCGESPPAGRYWRCANGHPFDVFATAGQCPRCPSRATAVTCFYCGGTIPLEPPRHFHHPQVH